MIRVPSNQICQQMWESGYDLLSYLVAGGDPNLAPKYRAACAKLLSSNGSTSDLAEVLRTAAAMHPDEIAFLEHKMHIVSYHPDGHWRDDEPIFELLRLGILVGYGFIHPRKPQDYPQPIPLDVWNRNADAWESSVSGNGMSFLAVRVGTMARYRRLVATTESQEAERPVGRPPVREKVREAFQALCEAKLIDADGSLSKTYQPIRDWLSRAYPENADQFSKLAGETIRRVITDDFKAMSSGNKQ